MDWPASFLLVLCLASGVQCEGCTVSDSNGIIIHPDAIQIHVLDNLLNGTLITEYTTDGVTGIDSVTNDYLDVKFDESTSKITVKVKDAYHRYEDTNNEPDITQRFKLICASSETIIMSVALLIKDTDNHPTRFNQFEMIFSIPMPYPGGLEITRGLDIWAYDWDFSSEVEVKIEDGDDSNKFELQTSKESADVTGPGHGKKPIVVVRIYSKEQLTQKELKFNLIAQDTNNNGNVAKLPVTIIRNETSSVPDSPIFSRPLYRTSVDDKMEPGDVLQIQDGAIEFPDQDLGSIDVEIFEGDFKEYFSVHKTEQGVEIYLDQKVTDTSIQYSLLTLRATIPKAQHPGFSVVFVKFSDYACPTTTAAPIYPRPGKKTSIPPTHGNLTFVVPNYEQHIMVGDVGHISWVVAKPHPSGIIQVHPIEYALDGLPDDLEDALMITDDGELVAQSPILQSGEYNFYVTAEIPGVAEKVRAKFILDVITANFCGNSSDSDVIFPYGFLSKTVKENHQSLLTSFPRPENLSCSWTTAEKPNLGKVRLEAHESINVYVDAIDREDEKFNGAVSPSILAEITASCVKINDSTSAFSNEQDDDTSTTHSTLVILIHVTDENDSPPKFESEKMVVGYPVQKIAEEERPPFMGVARAHDDDVGDNAIISYSIAGTTEAIVKSENGQFYPHPKHFEYQNTSFQIIATDGTHQTTLEVVVRILEPKYIKTLKIVGATLEDVPKLTKEISANTGLQIGVISATVKSVDVGKEKQRPKEYLDPKEPVPNGGDFVGIPRKDDTLYLRLVLYALNGGEPVSADQFNSSIVFESNTGKSHPALSKDEFPDGEAPPAERKKSVAFAEETMVIPREEELEAIPAETKKELVYWWLKILKRI